MESDTLLYGRSKRELKERVRGLLRNYPGLYVVSISRKGPKLLESLFADEQDLLENSNILTEYSLPFLFHTLALQKVNKPMIAIIDDAIYYGTTIQSITRLVKEYSRLTGVTPVIHPPYAAIIDKDASPSLQDVNAIKAERPGYGHYFIKRLTADIRSLHDTFEVEFPSVSFDLNTDFASSDLSEAITQAFGQERVYHIQHKGSESFNVLLPNENGSIFNKIRIYPDYARRMLHVVSIAPRVIENWEEDIEDLFKGTPLESLWERILQESELTGEDNNNDYRFYDDLFEDRNKCLVVLGNYLLSFCTQIKNKEAITRMAEYLDRDYIYNGLSLRQLFYLTANRSLCTKIKEELEGLYDAGQVCYSPYTTAYDHQDGMVFSGTESMTHDDLGVLDNQNRLMIRNSKNLQEALSALNFNQSILVEKRLRRTGDYDLHRLRFGYTFDAMRAIIQKYAPFTMRDEDLLSLHRWVDRRIDQGCLVPQYIETESGNWMRVFRPGENEDAILNHLTRFVLFVFNRINEVLRLGWIPTAFFEGMLCIAYKSLGIELSDDLGMSLRLQEKKLYFLNDDLAEYRSVLQYLFDMQIFACKDDKVRISPRLVDEELMRNTTLSDETQEKVRQKMSEVLSAFKVSGQPLGQAFLVLNLYLYDVENRDDATLAMKTAADNILKVLDAQMRAAEESMELWEKVHRDYIGLMDYVILPAYAQSEEKLQLLSADAGVRRHIASEQRRMNSLILELEVALCTFFIQDQKLYSHVVDDVIHDFGTAACVVSPEFFNVAKQLVDDYGSSSLRIKLAQLISQDVPSFVNDEQ